MAQQAASFHRMKQFVRHLVETQSTQCRKDYLEMVQDVRSLISLQFPDKPGFIDYKKSMCNVCVHYFCLNIIQVMIKVVFKFLQHYLCNQDLFFFTNNFHSRQNLPFYSLEML